MYSTGGGSTIINSFMNSTGTVQEAIKDYEFFYVQYSTVQYCTVQYSKAQYRRRINEIVQLYTVQYRRRNNDHEFCYIQYSTGGGTTIMNSVIYSTVQEADQRS
jgi:hypothetical protein